MTEGTRLVLGKHSGRHALRVKLAQLGYEPDAQELKAVFADFKNLADFKKDITDDDLHGIMRLRQVVVAG